MDMIELVKAAVFGVVEGITEWLPISSTGHMLLLNEFLTLDVSDEFWDMFLVVIQLGAILAVCVIFFHQLNPFAGDKTAYEKRATWTIWGKTIVACIPAAVVGIPLDDWMDEHLGSPFVIAAALIVYGVAFVLIENARERKAASMLPGPGASRASRPTPRHMARPAVAESAAPMSASERADANARIQALDDLDWRTVVGIGCFQVLSLVPGTSRSGSTIIGGLLLGCSRTVAAEFTFYLAIPVMAGASLLKVVKFALSGVALVAQELAILVVGCVVAFVVSLVAIRFLMGFVRRHDFKPFGWYRIVLGIVVIAYFLIAG